MADSVKSLLLDRCDCLLKFQHPVEKLRVFRIELAIREGATIHWSERARRVNNVKYPCPPSPSAS